MLFHFIVEFLDDLAHRPKPMTLYKYPPIEKGEYSFHFVQTYLDIYVYLDSTDIYSVLFLLNVLSLLRNLYSCIINNSYHGNNCIVPNRPAFDNYYGRKNTKWAIWVNIMYSTPAFSMRLNLKRPYFECLIWKKLNTQLSFYLTKSFGF